MISLSTLKIDASNGYGSEEEEMKILGQISWPEVAVPERKRPAKVTATVKSGREKEGARGRGERVGFPEMETLNLKLAIYSKFFPISADHNFHIRTPI